jgi:DNA polymerase
MSPPAVNLDFETRSDVDIKLGLDRYFGTPNASVLCLAYQMPEATEPVLWTPKDPMPKDLTDFVKAGGIVKAWNTMFEFMAWNALLVKQYGFPPMDLNQCVDSMAQAAAMSLPQALGGCAAALGLPMDQQKDTRGKYLIQRLCKPHPVTKTRDSIWVEDAALTAELYAYCLQDVKVERAISELLPELSDEEQATWLITQVINRRGLPVDTDEVCNVVKVIEAETLRLQDIAVAITGGIEVTQRTKLLEWFETQGLVTSTLDAATVEALLEDTSLSNDVRTVLSARAAVSQTSTAKFQKILDIAATDSTIKNLLVYHGASTGRFASRGGFNYQNLKRPDIKDPDTAIEIIAKHHDDLEFLLMLYPDLMNAIASCGRASIKAPAGFEFIDADFSSIENRCGPWLAGDKATMEMFRKGLDEYKVFASKMYNVKYEDVTKEMRQVSKSAVLGSMFGQGAKGLVEFAAGLGVTITPEKSKELVDLYRADRKLIVKMWYACGDAAMSATLNPGRQYKVGEHLTFFYNSDRDFLYMKLPSGRKIGYYQPRVQQARAPWGEMKDVVTHMAMDTYTRKWTRVKTIGAGFYQNAVQGVARDILCNAVVNLEAGGYKVVGLVHDEALSIVPSGHGDEKEYCALMCRPPAWLIGMPVAAESWRGLRYQK